jgi:hypothetical protein
MFCGRGHKTYAVKACDAPPSGAPHSARGCRRSRPHLHLQVIVFMTRKKCCALLRNPVPSLVLPTAVQLPEVTGSHTPTCIVNRCGIRLLVWACGSQRGRAPIRTMAADAALTRAMLLENVSISWDDSLRFTMSKESGGQVGIQNPSSSARGLFQLLKRTTT